MTLLAEPLILGAFAAGLLLCLLLNLSVLWALVLGFALFFGYGLFKGHGVKAMLSMALKGVGTVKNILIVFVLIGMITAVWRACGTIATLITEASRLIVPGAFLLIAFLLNALMSLLTGTAFGTAATVGVISMSIGRVMGVSPLFLGGAILSGAFLGIELANGMEFWPRSRAPTFTTTFAA